MIYKQELKHNFVLYIFPLISKQTIQQNNQFYDEVEFSNDQWISKNNKVSVKFIFYLYFKEGMFIGNWKFFMLFYLESSEYLFSFQNFEGFWKKLSSKKEKKSIIVF